jgi:hypothetical protein
MTTKKTDPSLRTTPNLELVRPESTAESQNVGNVADMRRAIELGAATSPLIRQCVRVATRRGLTREETYLLLASEALVRLGELHRVYEDTELTQGLRTRSLFDVDGHF